MKLLNLIGIVLILLPLCSKVKVLDATSQEWAGGVYASGYGTNFKITMVARGSSDQLVINDLWIGEDHFEVVAVKDLSRRGDALFAKKDTVYVSAGITYKPDENGRYKKTETGSKKAPDRYDGQALLGYTWKGKQKYVRIDEIRSLEKLIYP